MKLEITPTEYFSLASVTTKNTGIVKILITIDTHTQRTVTTQTVESLYCDLLLSGAGSYTREEFLNEVNMLGASIEVGVNDGKTTFVLRSTATKCKKLLELFGLLINEPEFSTKELKRVKSTELNQLHQAKENSKEIALDELKNGFYGSSDRKYSYSIDEQMAEVPKATVSSIKKHHQATITGRWTCSIAADQAIVTLFAKELKKLKRTIVVSDAIHQPKPPKPSLSLENIPSRQNIDLSIGVPLPITRAHPDFIPLTFAVAVLGKWGGFAGRLMSTVREKEGLTYGIYGQLEGFQSEEQGYFRIMTFFSPEKTVQGLTSTFREIKKLYDSGVTQNEVDSFKTILTTQQSLVNDSFTRVLSDLHGYHCENFTIEEMEELKSSLGNVTRADINRVIKTYLNPSQMSISGAGPTDKIQTAVKKWMAGK